MKVIPPKTPLSLKQAARVFGCRVVRAQRAIRTKEFREMLEAEMKAADVLEWPANLAAAIAIRDDPESDSRAATIPLWLSSR